MMLMSALVMPVSGQSRLVQYGFKAGCNLPCSRSYSVRGDYLAGLMSLEFGGFVRVGRFASAETGLGYAFMKGRYDNRTDAHYEDELVETLYLQIPLKLTGHIPIGKRLALLPHLGVICQPLLKVTDNDIGFSRQTLEKQMTLLTAGLDIRLGFIVIGASYRYSFRKFFRNIDGKHPQFVDICAGFQF